MNNKLSVIVPIYNVDKYLKKCVDSIINQTYKNLEIILVDDGSTDSSGKIADEYKKIDERIKVIHKKNGGLADARNAGIKIATGKYIAFVDSDDWIDCDAYRFSIELLEKSESDMLVFLAISCYSDLNILIHNDNSYQVIYNNEIFNYWNIIGRGVCDKIFLKKYWDDIQFPTGKTSEDIFVIYKLMAKSKKTILLSNTYYYYRQRLGSISKNNDVRFDSYEAYNNAKDFIKENYPQSFDKFMINYVTNLMGIYNSIVLYDDSNKFKSIFKKRIIQNRKYIYCSNVKIIKKIQLFILIAFPRLYKIIMKIKNNKIQKKLFKS